MPPAKQQRPKTKDERELLNANFIPQFILASGVERRHLFIKSSTRKRLQRYLWVEENISGSNVSDIRLIIFKKKEKELFGLWIKWTSLKTFLKLMKIEWKQNVSLYKCEKIMQCKCTDHAVRTTKKPRQDRGSLQKKWVIFYMAFRVLNVNELYEM